MHSSEPNHNAVEPESQRARPHVSDGDRVLARGRADDGTGVDASPRPPLAQAAAVATTGLAAASAAGGGFAAIVGKHEAVCGTSTTAGSSTLTGSAAASTGEVVHGVNADVM
jgi:hypothetical protein